MQRVGIGVIAQGVDQAATPVSRYVQQAEQSMQSIIFYDIQIQQAPVVLQLDDRVAQAAVGAVVQRNGDIVAAPESVFGERGGAEAVEDLGARAVHVEHGAGVLLGLLGEFD